MNQELNTEVRSKQSGWIQNLVAISHGLWARLLGGSVASAVTEGDVLDDADVENMRAWSISARLAAVPGDYLTQVPPEVAKLICESKELHPRMAAGAAERDARGEPCHPL